MDEAVLAALARWPDVPDVYGWLALDARGRFRLRAGGAGPAAFETIGNPALAAYIGRNYQHDGAGRWFFQNGPQRVFVRLAVTPWVFRLHGQDTPLAHTGRAAGEVRGLLLDEQASPVLLTEIGPGLVDDRDMGELLALLKQAGAGAADEAALARWLAGHDETALELDWRRRRLPVARIARARLGRILGFDADPRPPGPP